jgi:hypothetical protein
MSETATMTAQTPTTPAEILKRKPGRPAAGDTPAQPKKPGFVMKQLSTCVTGDVKKLSAQLQEKEHNIYAAGILVFASLSIDDQFKVIAEAKKLHAKKVGEEQAAAETVAG